MQLCGIRSVDYQ